MLFQFHPRNSIYPHQRCHQYVVHGGDKQHKHNLISEFFEFIRINDVICFVLWNIFFWCLMFAWEQSPHGYYYFSGGSSTNQEILMDFIWGFPWGEAPSSHPFRRMGCSHLPPSVWAIPIYRKLSSLQGASPPVTSLLVYNPHEYYRYITYITSNHQPKRKKVLINQLNAFANWGTTEVGFSPKKKTRWSPRSHQSQTPRTLRRLWWEPGGYHLHDPGSLGDRGTPGAGQRMVFGLRHFRWDF